MRQHDTDQLVGGVEHPPTVYMLIGLPGAGKSTWLQSQNWVSNCEIISTDILIEAEAARVGLTYDQVFKRYIKTANSILRCRVTDAVATNQDIVWDQTNLTKPARAAKLAKLTGYRTIAVVFQTPDSVEWQRRLGNRPGKTIPSNVLTNMVESFQPPVDGEFNEIWYAQI